MITRWKTVVTVLALPLSLAACSGEPSSSPGSTPVPVSETRSLLDALGKVKATAETRAYIEYGKPGETKTQLHAGYATIAPYSARLADRLKLDPGKFTAALTVGQPPDAAGILWGDYDTAAVNQALADAKIRREDKDGAAVWTVGEDNKVQLDGPLREAAPPTGFTKLHVATGSFAYAGSAASLATVTDPGQDTLAKDKDVQALAGCLKDVVAATIVRSERDPMPAAIGVLADGTEALCVLPAEGKAEDVREQIADKVGTGKSITGQPWQDLLPNAAAEVVDGQPRTVRLTGKPQRPGLLFKALANRDLPLPR
ncbi:hypothetical protein ALI144C_18705 [Actinosynnema sp. ALI-1.44]|uniref:hypothetical protein n=1 Tax=Actinosynnema sp. ALI-1.44 TaxID=1933779 RepID=UPI00097C3FB7|nr:hypothetical protein [Actinosynnema sp. ALI-1.44]ONI83063.1 hypothetical protein ALI144C_18705 [Actinosynnema sp. ALI-1.44]